MGGGEQNFSFIPKRVEAVPPSGSGRALEFGNSSASGGRTASQETIPVSRRNAEIVDVSDLPDAELISLAEARARSRALHEQEKAAAQVGGAALVAGGAGYALAKSGLWKPAGMFLGKWVVGPYAAWKSLPFIDWFANKLDKLADKMPGKDIPFVGLVCDAMDWVKMKIAPEKSLFEYIKKDKEERRKLAEKELKSLREGEKKMEKKEDDAAKKKKAKEKQGKAKKKLAARIGEDAADAVFDELAEIQREEEAKEAAEAVEESKA